jgi:hypothetical protein
MKFFGFIVSNKGIEIDLDKVKVIQKMSAPHPKLREVRGFLERLDCIARFIFQLMATCEPIFRLLRKTNLEFGMRIVKKPLIRSSNTY